MSINESGALNKAIERGLKQLDNLEGIMCSNYPDKKVPHWFASMTFTLRQTIEAMKEPEEEKHHEMEEEKPVPKEGLSKPVPEMPKVDLKELDDDDYFFTVGGKIKLSKKGKAKVSPDPIIEDDVIVKVWERWTSEAYGNPLDWQWHKRAVLDMWSAIKQYCEERGYGN